MTKLYNIEKIGDHWYYDISDNVPHLTKHKRKRKKNTDG